MDLNLFGMHYRVEFKVTDGEAEVFMDNAVIYINPLYPVESQRMSLMHEIAHVIQNYRLKYVFDAIKEVTDSDTREHMVLDPIANGFYECLKDNAELRQFLFEGGELSDSDFES